MKPSQDNKSPSSSVMTDSRYCENENLEEHILTASILGLDAGGRSASAKVTEKAAATLTKKKEGHHRPPPLKEKVEQSSSSTRVHPEGNVRAPSSGNRLKPTVDQYEDFNNGRCSSYHSANPIASLVWDDSDNVTELQFKDQRSGVNGVVVYCPEEKAMGANKILTREDVQKVKGISNVYNRLVNGELDSEEESAALLMRLHSMLLTLMKLKRMQIDMLKQNDLVVRTEYKVLEIPGEVVPGGLEALDPMDVASTERKAQSNDFFISLLETDFAPSTSLLALLEDCKNTGRKFDLKQIKKLASDMRGMAATDKAYLTLLFERIGKRSLDGSFKYRNPVKKDYQWEETYLEKCYVSPEYQVPPASKLAETLGIPHGVPPSAVAALAGDRGISVGAYQSRARSTYFGSYNPTEEELREWPEVPGCKMVGVPKHLARLLPQYQQRVGKVLKAFICSVAARLNRKEVVIATDAPASDLFYPVMEKVMEAGVQNQVQELFEECLSKVFACLVDGYFEQLWLHVHYTCPQFYQECEEAASKAQTSLWGKGSLEALRTVASKQESVAYQKRVHVSSGNTNAASETLSQRGAVARSVYFTEGSNYEGNQTYLLLTLYCSQNLSANTIVI
jgi:hypothetical protein